VCAAGRPRTLIRKRFLLRQYCCQGRRDKKNIQTYTRRCLLESFEPRQIRWRFLLVLFPYNRFTVTVRITYPWTRSLTAWRCRTETHQAHYIRKPPQVFDRQRGRATSIACETYKGRFSKAQEEWEKSVVAWGASLPSFISNIPSFLPFDCSVVYSCILLASACQPFANRILVHCLPHLTTNSSHKTPQRKVKNESETGASSASTPSAIANPTHHDDGAGSGVDGDNVRADDDRILTDGTGTDGGAGAGTDGGGPGADDNAVWTNKADGTRDVHPPAQKYRLTEAMKAIVRQLVVLINEYRRLENEKKWVQVLLSFSSFIGLWGFWKSLLIGWIVDWEGVIHLLANRGRDRFCIRRCVFWFVWLV